MSDKIESKARLRAEIRRHKIMSESDNRIKKILSVNENVKQFNDLNDRFVCTQTQTNSLNDSINDKKLQQNCDQTENVEKSIDILNENSVRHRFPQSLNGTDSQSYESSVGRQSEGQSSGQSERHSGPQSEPQSVDRTFPRKVSLISTPIDYKTLQQSHENNANTASLTSHLVWILSQNQIKISVISFLVLVAIIGSKLEFNFILPFLVTQLFRLLIVWRNHKNNGFNKTFSNISVMFSVLKQLTIFVFTYIVVQLFL